MDEKKNKRMASLPQNTRDFQWEIERMEIEIAINKLKVEVNEKRHLELERSREDVKMLKDKAQYLIRCNERKNERYQEQMAEMRQCLSSVSINAQTAQRDDRITYLSAKIAEMKKLKIKLEHDFNIHKRKNDEFEQTLAQLSKKRNKIKEECDTEDY